MFYSPIGLFEYDTIRVYNVACTLGKKKTKQKKIIIISIKVGAKLEENKGGARDREDTADRARRPPLPKAGFCDLGDLALRRVFI